MTTVVVAISLEKDVFDKIELLRGDIPRSKFIQRAVEKGLGLSIFR